MKAYSKKWSFFLLVSTLITMTFFISFNYFMDPMWTFNHEHKYNQYQKGGREREQKSNALYFRDKKYDTLILGSSRSAFINQSDFNSHTFNYCASDMKPHEYIHFLKFAKDVAKQDIKKVYIGLDFFGVLNYNPPVSHTYKTMFENIQQPFYRYKILSSLDTLNYSFKNMKYYRKKSAIKYTYNYVKTTLPFRETKLSEFNKNIQGDIDIYNQERYIYGYDENYKKYISELISNNQDIEFIIYTTPVSQKHFQNLIDNNLYDEYEIWLRDSVDVFGKINHFMYISDMAKEANIYFMDSNHMYAKSAKCLADEIQDKDSKCKKTKMVINKENIDEKIELLRSLNNTK